VITVDSDCVAVGGSRSLEKGIFRRRLKMPFKSKAQAKYMFAKKPELAKEFADATPSIKKLPEHVKKKAKNRSKK
jgi:hypothetical protein